MSSSVLWRKVTVLIDVTNTHCKLCFLLPLSIDVTEVQIFIIIMYLLAAVGGSAFWQSLVIVIGFNSYRLSDDVINMSHVC